MQLLCGQCGKIVEIGDTGSATTASCPGCGYAIPIPVAHGHPTAAGGTHPAHAEQHGFAEQARNASHFRIRLVCNSCRKAFSASGRIAGRNAKCPKCGQPVTVPYPDDNIALPVENHRSRVEKVGNSPAAPAGSGFVATHPPSTERPREEVLPSARNIKSRQANMLLSGLILMAILIGALAFFLIPKMLVPERSENDSIELPNRKIFGRADQNGSSPAASVTDETNLPPHKEPRGPMVSPPASPKPPEPTLDPDKPSCTVVSATADVFASGGYYPAQLELIYVKVQVKITTAKKALSFKTYGPDVTLDLPSGRLESLGLVADKSAALVKSVQSAASIDPGKTATLTFLFEAPAVSAGGQLTIRDVGSAAISRIDVPEIPQNALQGQFEEKLPRNLKPLLRDPVMAAFQASSWHRLRIRTYRGGRKGVFVVFEPLKMKSQLVPAGNDVYDVKLVYGQHELNCKLRLTDGGRTLVLYLAMEPFHQLTFVRRS